MILVLILTKAPKIGEHMSRLAWSGTAFGLCTVVAIGAAALA